MKLKLLSFLSFIFIMSSSIAQIDGHHCGFDHVREKLHEEHPEFKVSEQQMNTFLEQYKEDRTSGELNKKNAAAIVIPVVFHIIHDDGVENISREQILSAVDRLNECYNGSNPELSILQPEWEALQQSHNIVGVANVEFKLAKIAPDGSCFNGVTRTKSTTTFDANESSQLNAVVNGNDVFQGQWPSNMYLNIFVANAIGSPGAAAYAYFPNGSSAMRYGVWSQHVYIGSTGTSTAGRSGTVVHELGHWFSLYHPWGSKNLVGDNDPVPSDCGRTDNNDFVDDTPKTIGNKDCVEGVNTCSDDNAYWSSNYGVADMIDNVENFMEYSYCFKMFTQGQSDRMLDVLNETNTNSSNYIRYQIWQPGNLAATGVDQPAALCKADFTTSRTTICAGETIDFKDESYSNQVGWAWDFEGGSVVGSINDENPSVTYNTPGTFNVSLDVTDGSSSISSLKTDYITVLPNPGSLAPYTESFENTASLPDVNWAITDEYSGDYNIVSTASVTGNNSLRITNSGSRRGNVYQLISSTIDIPANSEPVISFKWAFARRSTDNRDVLKVYVSNDCGENFLLKRRIASGLPTADVHTSGFVPTSAEWDEILINNMTDEFGVSNFRVMFELTSDGGNYLYLEDINVDYNTLVGVDEINENTKHSIYPNPAKELVNIDMEFKNNSNVLVNVYDIVGRKVLESNLGSLVGRSTQTIRTEALTSGTYILEVLSDGVSIAVDKINIE